MVGRCPSKQRMGMLTRNVLQSHFTLNNLVMGTEGMLLWCSKVMRPMPARNT